MKIYLGIKFHDDNSNRPLIEALSRRLEALGHQVFCVARDLENWGCSSFSPEELMTKTFEQIDASDMVLIEFSEKGVGLGIEAGYAHGKEIPVYVIAQMGSEISNTMRGIASRVIHYRDHSEIQI